MTGEQIINLDPGEYMSVAHDFLDCSGMLAQVGDGSDNKARTARSAKNRKRISFARLALLITCGAAGASAIVYAGIAGCTWLHRTDITLMHPHRHSQASKPVQPGNMGACKNAPAPTGCN